ncbi:MAG TPA: hypothetical protein VMT62_11915 [Syntrophorhabdaceae bacterium]|nr:hypothetical protein [Syntrophorhabdaceae bacterium]
MKKFGLVIVACMVLSGFAAVRSVHADEIKVGGVSPQAGSLDAVTQADKAKEPETPKVTGSGSIGFYNQYIFRGYEIGKSGLVIEPSLTESYKGFTATFWGNVDSNERNTTSAVFGNEGRKGWDETDFSLSYTYTISKLSLTGGYTYYALKYAEETEELWLTLALDVLTKPTLSVYQDIQSYKGTYFNLAFAHSFTLPKDITLDLGASFGYEIGESNYWKTYQTATGDYTGSKYRGFHDGMVKAGLTIPVTKAFTIQPLVQYWFPLSSNANKTFGTDPATGLKIAYNPNGYVPDNLIYGVGFTYSF